MGTLVTAEAALAPTWIPRSPTTDGAPVAPRAVPQYDVGASCPIPASVGVQLIDVQDSQQQETLQTPLRNRLTAAARLIVVCLILLFVQSIVTSDFVVPWLRGSVLVVTIGTLVLFQGTRKLAARQLRAMELVLFGAVGVQFVTVQLNWLLVAAHQENAAQLLRTSSLGTVGFTVVMLAYGMFIPNGWRRTALMLIPPVCGPVLASLFVRSVSDFAAATITSQHVLETAVILAISAGVAVFGTRTIADLRQEVRRAKRFGQYRLRGVLGRGGMGHVYLAEHQLLKRPCAIKVIRTDDGADPYALERFEREVCATARLTHWHTVEIYDYGRTQDGTFYYVMEYLRGMNLGELVLRYGPMQPARVIHFLSQTCLALQEAHAKGLIHRDLKPANIFAAQRGGVSDFTKLLDFGLVLERTQIGATGNNEAARHGSLAGSPFFMSPEQASGQATIDARSDLYSLGAVGYFLLTGRPPFDGSSPLGVMLAHVQQPILPPSMWRTGVPRDLEQILLRCLEKSPDRRYASACELRRALVSCQDTGWWSESRARDWWAGVDASVFTDDLPTRPPLPARPPQDRPSAMVPQPERLQGDHGIQTPRTESFEVNRYTPKPELLELLRN